MTSDITFSVLMSTYYKDVPDYLDLALSSIVNQTYPPAEIVLVKDGELINELDEIIDKWAENTPGLFTIVPLRKNVGLGLALRAGLEKCSYELVARMDSDDYSKPYRFERQIEYYSKHPEVDVLSSWTEMFNENPGDVLFIRRFPTEHCQITGVARYSNAIYHGSCMFRRSAVLHSNSYERFPGMEDYHLWARMIMNGKHFACLPEAIYCVRWEESLIKRRAGLKYALRHFNLQKEFLKIGFISYRVFVRNLIVRFATAVVPAKLLMIVRRLRGL